MGAYSEYLNRAWTASGLNAERKIQLQRISERRGGRDVLVIASDMTKSIPNVSNALDFSDILPVQDQLSVLKGKELDVIIETPGGLAEVAEDIARQISRPVQSRWYDHPGVGEKRRYRFWQWLGMKF